jgi:hypothetical protein
MIQCDTLSASSEKAAELSQTKAPGSKLVSAMARRDMSSSYADISQHTR